MRALKLLHFRTTRDVFFACCALVVLEATPVSAWGIRTGSKAAVRRAPGTKQTSELSAVLKPVTCLSDASGGSVQGGRIRNRRREPFAMTNAAKEGDVVLQSVKVGPLKQEQVVLSTGVSMEALCQGPSRSSANRRLLPPLVFIHGSYHAAWCWAEHWMPFLANKGYETYSVSLRGTSGTRVPDSEGDAKRVKIKTSEHVSDVRSFLQTFLPGRSPVLISHSFGGMVLLKLMEELAQERKAAGAAGTDGGRSAAGFEGVLAGVVFLCSVPPSGNGAMTKRFIKERPLLAVKIAIGFVLKMAVFWPWLARELFFSKALDQKTLKRYLKSFRADSENGLDLMDLRGKLPSRFADAEGRATWIEHAPPRLVMGAERDCIVDEEGVEEMATFLDTTHVMLPTVPHEVMLSPDWPLGVDRLLQWLEATDFQLPATP